MDASDAIIIGAGAGGGTMARQSAPSGRRSSCSGAATGSCASSLALTRLHEERRPGGRVRSAVLPVRHSGVGVEHQLPSPDSTTSTSWTQASSRASAR